MAGSYNVHLCDKTGMLAPAHRAKICEAMQAFFDQITAHTTATIGAATCGWADQSTTVLGNELLVYFVRNHKHSLIFRLWGIRAKKDQGGRTGVDKKNGVLSEVYFEEMFAKGSGMNALEFAGAALHELMHNKLNMGNRELHSEASGGGIAGTKEKHRPVLTARNIELMAPALNWQVPQCTKYLKFQPDFTR